MLTRRTFLASLAAAPGTPYLDHVRKFADTLLAHGLDAYGERRTPLWAGVIDAAAMTVPSAAAKVPPPAGIRPQDRAVGGSNPYHDAVSWQAFRVLGALTGDPRYARAVRDAQGFFLSACVHRETGLLAWGEHLYYDFFRDQVDAGRKYHELLEWTPPWPALWEVNPGAVTKAIAGIRYHFYADDPATLFNRHAYWDRPEHQKPGGQPWIKHTGLYAYSFAFLHSKTRDPLWLKWARGPAALYWNRRNRATNLTLGCIGDPRPDSSLASAQMPELAYWLYKAWQLCPAETPFRDRARAFLSAFDRYFYDPRLDSFVAGLSLDGKRQASYPMPVWTIGYGESGILSIGRIAAYIGRAGKEAAFIGLARRIAAIARRTPVPANVSLACLAFALNLSLDLYDHAPDPKLLAEARAYADRAIERFWYPKDGGGLFVREPGDHYYEAKAGVGDLLAGLLRLHLRTAGAKDPGVYDWSY